MRTSEEYRRLEVRIKELEAERDIERTSRIQFEKMLHKQAETIAKLEALGMRQGDELAALDERLHDEQTVVEQLKRQISGLEAERDALKTELAARPPLYEDTRANVAVAIAQRRGAFIGSQDERIAELTRIVAGLRVEIAQSKAAERERCAKACESSDRYRGDYFAAKCRDLGDE